MNRNLLLVAGIAIFAACVWILLAPALGRSAGEKVFGTADRPTVASTAITPESATPKLKPGLPAVHATVPAKSGPVPVSRDEFGAGWPFAPPIVYGAVDCLYGDRPVFISGGTSYALTPNIVVGPSLKRLGLVEVDGIRRDLPGRKGLKIDIDPIIALARKRCTK